MADPPENTRNEMPTGARESVLDRGETRRIGGGASEPVPVHEPEHPHMIDRYLVVEPLGSGGMGVVYAAYDPVLNRKVALKLLHARSDDEQAKSEGRTRLVREAQAIARLNHPNVVSVFDVGTIDERVYMATEFLDGLSLKQWLREGTHTTEEILEVFVQAGRGLAAAHAAGLVHRDFKPANVLVPTDGRVRVLDFGLARASGLDPETAAALDTGAPSSLSATDTGLLSAPLTLSGAIVGTPAYMAPEQHLNAETDARTDQFSFCIALWEALYGQRPFLSREYDDLRKQVVAGKIDEPPGESKVPARLRRVLLRGLSVRPEARYPSMDELLAELSRDPMAKWRRGALALAGVGLLGALAFRALNPASAESLCTGAEQHLVGTWDDDARGRLRASFGATDLVYQAAAADGAVAALDAYSADWVAMHTEACEAHHVTGEQSAELMDRRMLCLDRRRTELAALAQVLIEEADAAVIENAVEAAQGLPPVAACGDLEALSRPSTIPDDPATRAAVTEVREMIARATALRRAAKYAASREVVDRAVEAARALDVPHVSAEALSAQARLLDSSGESKQAEQVYYEALAAAERGENDPVRARILTELVWVVGHQLGRPDAVDPLEAQAAAAVERTHAEDVRVILLQHVAVVRSGQGRHDEAVDKMERSIELLSDQVAENSLQMAGSRNRLGAIYFARGDYAAALPQHEAALEVRRRVLGPDHPLVSHSLGNVALGHFTDGEFDKALAEYEQAQAILERAIEPDNIELARGYINLGGVLSRMGNYERAREYHAKARALCERKLGAEHPLTASATYTLGQDLAGLGRLDEALERYREALGTWEKVLGDDHPQLAHALTGIGMIEASNGRYEPAIKALERAHDIRAGSEQQDPSLLAETDFALAKALDAAKRDPARAIELARSAADGYRAAGAAHAEFLAKVEAWLAERG